MGARFIQELENTFLRVSENPASYQEVMPDFRRAVTHTYPHLVFFAHTDEAVHILAVLLAAQDPDYIASKLLS
ncbi:MAG: type II toxin-antitoxin system RelE/ParE family toxin [Gammaproteobacteria bacterium]|nr:type II toxin-antitoxin system RelE/ParE family toxin [Gammaproteobacteria bacterium]MBI5616788.1 type II toxin-antitoxin system RelE/ParE family toxin [Gammaproteobacteria bacterium]